MQLPLKAINLAFGGNAALTIATFFPYSQHFVAIVGWASAIATFCSLRTRLPKCAVQAARARSRAGSMPHRPARAESSGEIGQVCQCLPPVEPFDSPGWPWAPPWIRRRSVTTSSPSRK